MQVITAPLETHIPQNSVLNSTSLINSLPTLTFVRLPSIFNGVCIYIALNDQHHNIAFYCCQRRGIFFGHHENIP